VIAAGADRQVVARDLARTLKLIRLDVEPAHHAVA
jgi:hypothetical protein